MARRIDNNITRVAKSFFEGGENPFIFMKRFLDDFLKLYKGSTKVLHAIFEEINKLHPNIKYQRIEPYRYVRFKKKYF